MRVLVLFWWHQVTLVWFYKLYVDLGFCRGSWASLWTRMWFENKRFTGFAVKLDDDVLGRMNEHDLLKQNIQVNHIHSIQYSYKIAILSCRTWKYSFICFTREDECWQGDCAKLNYLKIHHFKSKRKQVQGTHRINTFTSPRKLNLFH